MKSIQTICCGFRLLRFTILSNIACVFQWLVQWQKKVRLLRFNTYSTNFERSHFGKMKLWRVEHFHNIFVFTFGRDCYCIQQSRPKVKTNMLWKCSTRQSFIFLIYRHLQTQHYDKPLLSNEQTGKIKGKETSVANSCKPWRLRKQFANPQQQSWQI